MISLLNLSRTSLKGSQSQKGLLFHDSLFPFESSDGFPQLRSLSRIGMEFL